MSNTNLGTQSGTEANPKETPQAGELNPSPVEGEASGTQTATTSDSTAGVDLSKLDPAVQKMITDLRKENANSRTKNKSLAESHGKLKQALIETGLIENDEEAPEEKLKTISQQNEIAMFQNGILEAAIEYGVSKEDLKFFRFLVSEKVSSLGEEEELSEEDISAIALEAKRNNSSVGTTSINANTSPKPGASGAVTLEKFVKMNIGEKTELYMKNKDLYLQLIAEAKSKKMLV